MQLPDLESLRCFDAAARHLNFRRAAAEMALSPSAFSERLSRLEESFGVLLFDRTTRTVRLTEAGRRMHPEVLEMFQQGQRCIEAARGDGPMPEFTLRLGTRYELGLSWLVPAVSTLQKARPERLFSFYFGDSQELMEKTMAGKLDAFISSTRTAQSGTETASLHVERYVFIGLPSLLAAHPLKHARDAEQHVLLDIDVALPLFRYFLDVRPVSESWRFRRVECLGTIAAVRLRALEGAGIAMLPHYFVERDIAEGRFIQLFSESEPRQDIFRLIWGETNSFAAELRTLAGELSALPLR